MRIKKNVRKKRKGKPLAPARKFPGGMVGAGPRGKG